MSTLDMVNFKEFPSQQNQSLDLEICDDQEQNTVNKIYLAFYCHNSESNIIEFQIAQKNSSHEPISFYMKKLCGKGKVPELNVLMTTDKSKSLEKNYEHRIIDKSGKRAVEELPIIIEDQVYFYISSEIGKQILIYPHVTINSSEVKGYLTGQGTFG